jgi:predicted nuclease of predicted toxin-antitoxin system
MNILADESVDHPVYEALKENGFNIKHIAFIGSGSTDTDVLDIAWRQKRVLLSVDKDFGELAFRAKKPSHGIVLYRLSGLTNHQKAEIVLKVFTERSQDIVNSFVVISRNQVRIRKLI